MTDAQAYYLALQSLLRQSSPFHRPEAIEADRIERLAYELAPEFGMGPYPETTLTCIPSQECAK